MKTNFSAAFIAIFAAATLSACASAPRSDVAAASNDSPAATYCKGQAQLISQRMAVNSMQNSPLAGRADPQDVKAYLMRDCMAKVASR